VVVVVLPPSHSAVLLPLPLLPALIQRLLLLTVIPIRELMKEEEEEEKEEGYRHRRRGCSTKWVVVAVEGRRGRGRGGELRINL
jgi:hypothetical protein